MLLPEDNNDDVWKMAPRKASDDQGLSLYDRRNRRESKYFSSRWKVMPDSMTLDIKMLFESDAFGKLC